VLAAGYIVQRTSGNPFGAYQYTDPWFGTIKIRQSGKSTVDFARSSSMAQ
jgi:hypothetical protein